MPHGAFSRLEPGAGKLARRVLRGPGDGNVTRLPDWPAAEERYRTYIEHAPEGIFVSDNRGRFVDVNPSVCAMVGYARSELLTMVVTDLLPPDMASAHSDTVEQVLATERHELEIGLRRKDGTDIVGSLRTIILPGNLVMSFCVDITERKLAEEQIHNLAYFDPLTGLPNRRLLRDRLRQLMAVSDRNRGFGALLMLDLDHFKDLKLIVRLILPLGS